MLPGDSGAVTCKAEAGCDCEEPVALESMAASSASLADLLAADAASSSQFDSLVGDAELRLATWRPALPNLQLRGAFDLWRHRRLEAHGRRADA